MLNKIDTNIDKASHVVKLSILKQIIKTSKYYKTPEPHSTLTLSQSEWSR